MRRRTATGNPAGVLNRLGGGGQDAAWARGQTLVQSPYFRQTAPEIGWLSRVCGVAYQQAAARRGIRRMGMRIGKGITASSPAGAEGATRSGLSRGGCAPAHKLHGQRNKSSGETRVVTCSLY